MQNITILGLLELIDKKPYIQLTDLSWNSTSVSSHSAPSSSPSPFQQSRWNSDNNNIPHLSATRALAASITATHQSNAIETASLQRNVGVTSLLQNRLYKKSLRPPNLRANYKATLPFKIKLHENNWTPHAGNCICATLPTANNICKKILKVLTLFFRLRLTVQKLQWSAVYLSFAILHKCNHHDKYASFVIIVHLFCLSIHFLQFKIRDLHIIF